MTHPEINIYLLSQLLYHFGIIDQDVDVVVVVVDVVVLEVVVVIMHMYKSFI